MNRDKVTISKREVIYLFLDSMIPVDCCQKDKRINNFTTYDMASNSEFLSKKTMDALYLTESMRTYWLHMLDEYW